MDRHLLKNEKCEKTGLILVHITILQVKKRGGGLFSINNFNIFFYYLIRKGEINNVHLLGFVGYK